VDNGLASTQKNLLSKRRGRPGGVTARAKERQPV
jgi:hypothetical protein